MTPQKLDKSAPVYSHYTILQYLYGAAILSFESQLTCSVGSSKKELLAPIGIIQQAVQSLDRKLLGERAGGRGTFLTSTAVLLDFFGGFVPLPYISYAANTNQAKARHTRKTHTHQAARPRGHARQEQHAAQPQAGHKAKSSPENRTRRTAREAPPARAPPVEILKPRFSCLEIS